MQRGRKQASQVLLRHWEGDPEDWCSNKRRLRKDLLRQIVGARQALMPTETRGFPAVRGVKEVKMKKATNGSCKAQADT